MICSMYQLGRVRIAYYYDYIELLLFTSNESTWASTV